jgi:hypothetical protein
VDASARSRTPRTGAFRTQGKVVPYTGAIVAFTRDAEMKILTCMHCRKTHEYSGVILEGSQRPERRERTDEQKRESDRNGRRHMCERGMAMSDRTR